MRKRSNFFFMRRGFHRPAFSLFFSVSVYVVFCITGIFGCSSTLKVKKIDHEIFSLSKTATPATDTLVMRFMAPYKRQVDKEMNEVLGKSEVAMTKNDPEGLLGNFVADLSLGAARENYKPVDGKIADFCFLNNGGLRYELPAAQITRGMIFQLMPFENALVVLTLTGEQTLELINRIAAMGGMPVSGIRFGIKEKQALHILINGESFDMSKNYKVVTSDYLAEGGDNFSCLKNPIQYEVLNIKVRDAIISHISHQGKNGNTLNPILDGRIYYEK